jgi:BirA family biotin operon repressor/biotin-[acetyl-CoA-carboxylase] ligase
VTALGTPRLHFRLTDSTNARARELAAAGAPHGTIVTAREQSAGRGRQGRTWSAVPGRALLCSIVLRDPPKLLPLTAGVAVAEVAGAQAQIKWPNDVLLDGRKIAGILVEGRPQEGWAVLGIGLNVALRDEDFPRELRDRAGTLGLEPQDIEPTLQRLLGSLEGWLVGRPGRMLEEVRARDALVGRRIRWGGGGAVGGGEAMGGREGVATGIDNEGRLIVQTASGRVALDAGEVHLTA